ncbi:phage terminase small subunit P27 family [Pseudooceanicola sp.]|uniref:phage terminase small subunit P27 family n=1 Tax=Pseudooceanicola sp. TaxID=1914328 RepID=UPI0035C78B2C
MAIRGPKPRATVAPNLQKGGIPRCPDHLDHVARKEWRRLVRPLFEAGIVTTADRAALAAYCQSYSLWADAVQKLQETPKLIKAPSGYIQQSPWISIANKQLELMGRYMAELGLTPAARSRLDVGTDAAHEPVTRIELVAVSRDDDGNLVKRPLHDHARRAAEPQKQDRTITYQLDERL